MSLGLVLFRGGMIGGAHYPLRCKQCSRDSFIARSWRNALGPLILLAIGLLCSLPSPLSDSLLSSLGQDWAVITRALIWSVTMLSAIAWFAFANPLTPLHSPPELSLKEFVRVRIINLIIQISALLSMYFIMRDLMGTS